MLGSLAEAEDAVQETYVRWYRLTEAERAAIGSPQSWLTTVATRVCLDLLGSARVRRERYVGEWLPEPLPGGASLLEMGRAETTDPAARLAQQESLSMAVMVLLESMTPAQRAVFVLHDVLQYPFDEVAQLVGRSPEACRQLGSQARKRVRGARASLAEAMPADYAQTVRAFKRAWERADIAALTRLLEPNARAITDGGGRVHAALAPLEGAQAIAEFLVGALTRQPGLALCEADVNGQAGLLAHTEGVPRAVIAFRLGPDGRVRQLWAVRNPAKLGPWQPQGAARRTPSGAAAC